MAAVPLKITDNGNGILVQGTDNVFFPDNATLTFPYNSIILIVDESDMVTFRSAANNDVLFSGQIGKIDIGEDRVTKANIIEKFDAVANQATGGGDIDYSGLFAGVSYDSQTKHINFYDKDDTLVTYVDATAFIKDGMVSNVEILNGNLVITFNTDAGKEPITIPLTDIFNPSNYYTKTDANALFATQVVVNEEIAARIAGDGALNTALGTKADKSDTYTKTQVDDALALKQDASTAFSGDYDDLTNKPDLSVYAESADLATVATSGSYNDLSDKPVIPEGVTVDAALSDTSENPVQNKVVKGAIDEAKAYYISFATIATTGIRDEDWDGIVAAIDGHRPIYAGYPKNNGGILYYGVECMNKNGNNTQIILTSSDDSSHYFYTFTKNGSNDYSYTVETRPYTTAAEKDAWNAKQDVISDLAKIRSNAALGATAYQKPNTGIPASDIADGVIPTVPTNVSAFTNDAGYLTQHQSLDDYYTKNEVDAELADKQDTLTAGTGITIDANNIISSTGGTQVQADWNQTDDTAVDFIKNKPTIPDTSDFVSKSEYNPKEVAIAEALTDLNENKADKTEIPNVSNYYTKSEVDAELADKQDTLTAGTGISIQNNVISATGGGGTQVQSDWNQSDSSAVDYIKNKPTIPTVPTNVSSFTNDAHYVPSSDNTIQNIVKKEQSEYDTLVNNSQVDPNTLYIIVPDSI